tara:strand:- start:243 stop:1043 length:801 start_codon:yes stop_codon:yes gene_type:complete
MFSNQKVLIFSDLDGTLLNRDTFSFDEIKNYILYLISNDISLIPNSSKTKEEINEFNKKLGEDLPYIVENGAAIFDLHLINSNFPEEIVLSREIEEILTIFNEKIPKNLVSKLKFLHNLDLSDQMKILGLSKEKIRNALKRKYSIPLLFNGNISEKREIKNLVKSAGLTLQEGGRVINLCDNVSKSTAMKKVVKLFNKISNDKLTTIAVGDNFNDLEMLKNSDIPCLVFNDKFTLETININNCLVSKKSAPEGWEEIVKLALDKIK